MSRKGVLLVTLMALSVCAAAQATPSSPDRQVLGQGVTLVLQGKYENAEPILRRALALNPTLREGHYNLGVVLRQTGRPQAALLEYRVALALFDPEDRAGREKCLYGIALASDESHDALTSTHAWNEYIAYVEEAGSDRPILTSARRHRDMAMRLAGLKVPGTKKATRE